MVKRRSIEVIRLLTVNEVWVIAALAQLHHGVHEVGHVGGRRALGQVAEVLLEDGAVVLLLDVGQLHLDDRLLFGRDRLLDVLFKTPQHHRLENLRREQLNVIMMRECSRRSSA